MSPSKFSSSLIFILQISCIFLRAPTMSAHNITRILDRDPNFSTFNELLTGTHLADQINSRKTITVLAIPNDNIGDLASRPTDVAKAILMSHIVLDYYDILKLQKMKGKSIILTTLYQTTGVASYQQGFLNVTEDKSTGQIVFGSAVKGAPHNVNYLDTVATLPYNISVLSVSGPIIAPGIGGQTLRPIASAPKSNAPAPKLAPPPAEAPEAEAPAADAPAAEAPAPSDDDSEAPAADAPASSPSADGPTSDDASDDADSTKSSAHVKHFASPSSLAFLVVLASFLFVH